MKMKILLIRHGKTKGNLEGRYIGCRTDESLCEDGRKELQISSDKIRKYCKDNTNVAEENSFRVYSGYMKRCSETVEVLFPEHKYTMVDDFSEIDFGDFENKNYEELNGNSDYQRWIDSGGRLDYPNGEKMPDFILRSMKGFYFVLNDMREQGVLEAALICHGGNIMSIMSVLTGKNYFDFQVKNAGAIEVELEVNAEIETKIGESSVDFVSYRFV